MNLIEKGMELLFPSNIYCISCGSVIDKTRPYALCDSCMERFHWLGKKTCEKCGKILNAEDRHERCYDCMAYGHDFDKGFTCVQYGLYERGVIMDYKYRGKAYIGRKLGEILSDRMELEEVEFDLLVPVPMYRKKQERRGYNPAAVMAAAMASKSQMVYAGGLLCRTRETLPMKGLGAFERHENLRDAFAVSPQNKYPIKGKKILLVDDIYTTGSTADACSRALRKAGADSVCILTFACGPNIPPKQ